MEGEGSRRECVKYPGRGSTENGEKGESKKVIKVVIKAGNIEKKKGVILTQGQQRNQKMEKYSKEKVNKDNK